MQEKREGAGRDPRIIKVSRPTTATAGNAMALATMAITTFREAVMLFGVPPTTADATVFGASPAMIVELVASIL